jgi:tRNA A37 threonylcarbamoyladenosine synthetase subunit TsaC/SUA5/YrdC
MNPAVKPILFSCLALGLAAGLTAGCADTTKQTVGQKTDAAITDTEDAMNKLASEMKEFSTNVASHVVDFSTNAWAKTRQGAHKTADVTTNVVNDVKQGFK